MKDPAGVRESPVSVSSDGATIRTQVVVVGSGAGGASTAVTLAEAGYEVLVLEEVADPEHRDGMSADA